MKQNATKFIALNAVIASLYVVLTMPFGIISTSAGFQFRPAEALKILPSLMPYITPGLAIGCAISNMVSAFGVADIVFGSIITLTAGYLSSKTKNPWLASLPPILLNAIFLPLIWLLAVGDAGYLINLASLLLTQSAVIFGLGVPLHFIFKKRVLPLLNQKL